MQIRLRECAFVLNFEAVVPSQFWIDWDNILQDTALAYALSKTTWGLLNFDMFHWFLLSLSLKNLHKLLKRAVLQHLHIDSDRVAQYWSIYKISPLNPKQGGGGGAEFAQQAGSFLWCPKTVSSRKLKLCDFYYILIGFNFEYKPVPRDMHCCHCNTTVEDIFLV